VRGHRSRHPDKFCKSQLLQQDEVVSEDICPTVSWIRQGTRQSTDRKHHSWATFLYE
jgi:hypothetical protein